MPPSPLPTARPLANKPLNIPQTQAQALELHKAGRLAEADRLYAAILAVRPDHFDALHLSGLIKMAQGQLAEALRLIGAAMKARTPTPQIWLNHGILLNALARHQEAIDSFDQAIKLKSKFAEAHNNRGVVLATLGRDEEALESYAKALAITPNYAEALSNRGNALLKLKRYDDALKAYDRAVAARPDYADAHYNRGNVFKDLGRADEALACYDRALAVQPELAPCYINRGVLLADLGRNEEALASYDKVLTLAPGNVEATYNRGHVLEKLKRYDEALAAYDQAIAVHPALAEAHANRGNALRELKRFPEALASYDRALELRPDLIEALSNRGMILHELKRLDDALPSYDRALELRPDYVDALNNRGQTYQELKRFEEAQADFDRLLAVNPHHNHGFSGACSCAINLCDWERRERFAPLVADHITHGKSAFSPFVLFGYSDDPALQLQCAKNYIENRIPRRPAPLWTGQKWRNEKIRVAYLSADFRAHATSFLMAEMFERHDKSRFETYAISFSTDDQSDMRRRLIAAFNQFHDVRGQSDRDVAQLLRDLQIDIAVDLKGYTQDARSEIFEYRPAPIHANYLGYPGSLGSRMMDYIIGDHTVTPFENAPFFSEKIVQLPDSYQVNDTHRRVSPNVPTRQQAGLPERGFVFCSFNNNWKITPAVFDVWMRLLRQIDGSVLWLLGDNDGSMRNLRLEAQKRGIDPSRLVFADRMVPEEHLARHALADLFLDTLPCNAHTTASDALWVGLPILTCEGEAFAGRVAASLLRAVGLPHLVATSLEDYEARALRFAREPVQLAICKRHLLDNRMSLPLFDTARFTRHIEAAYTTMWETWQRGEPPQAFAVAPIS
jgi:predicted O-linked N-acetylglucosamine transferase (SPINDLY family)